MKSFDISQAEAAMDDLNTLLDTSFGPGRLARTAERLREGNRAVAEYTHMASTGAGDLVGTISYWPIAIGKDIGLLLGPLAVHPDMQGQGVGQALMRASLQIINADRYAFVLLVGDLPYYEKTGFGIAPDAVAMPGPVDAKRLLLRPTDSRHATLCSALAGKVRPAPEMC